MSDDDLESFKTNSDEKQINKRTLQAAGAIIALWAFTLVAFNIPSNWQFIPVGDRGSFGDMFGGLNALFSGFAFVGIIYTILLQRIELKLQRKELELTRNVLEEQRKEMSEQSDTLKLQSFENTFFSMLKLHIDFVEALKTTKHIGKGNFEEIIGREVFTYNRNILKNKYDQCADDAVWVEQFEKWFDSNLSKFGPYFRLLYNLIRLVDEAGVSNRKRYTDLVRAQLSADELVLIFYGCLSIHGSEKFKPLVERYSLLKHLPKDRLFNSVHDLDYEKSAFLEPNITSGIPRVSTTI